MREANKAVRDDAERGEERHDEYEELIISYSGELRRIEKVSRCCVQRPLAICGGIWVVIAIMGLVAMVAGWANIQETATEDWIVPSSPVSKNSDALEDAREQLDSANTESNLPVRSEDVWYAPFSFIYEWADDNREDEIFTSANLRRMCQFQSIITADSAFPKFCKPEGEPNGTNTICADQAYDIVSKIYPTFEEQKTCPELTSAEFTSRFLSLAANPEDLYFFLERRISSASDVRLKTRSQLSLYGPLGSDTTGGKRYAATSDEDTDEQGQLYKSFTFDMEKKIFAEWGMSTVIPFNSVYNVHALSLGDGLQVRFYNNFLVTEEFQRLVSWDQLLVGGSVFLVGVAMMLHLRSLFLTCIGLFAILASIPVALFLYTGILQIHYFSSVHVVTFFLILGIGADDLFVWVDAFMQSERYWHGIRGYGSKQEAAKANIYGTGDLDREILVARLVFTYQRAAGAVFNTSITTAGAFLATAVSPIAPIASFGIFAAITIMVNFVWTIAMYPAVCILFERYFKGRPFCFGWLRKAPKELSIVDSTSQPDKAEGIERRQNEDGKDILILPKPEHMEKWEEKAFSKLYVPFINTKIPLQVGSRILHLFPVVLICVMGLFAMIVFMCTHAILLDTPTEPDQNFRASHMFTGFANDYSKWFLGGNDYMTVEVTFGIKGVDRSGFKFLNPQGYRGSAIFDDSFDLASRANQEYMIEVCESFANLSCTPVGSTQPLEGCVADEAHVVTSVDCTLAKFHTWYNETYPNNTSALDLGEENKILWTDRLQEWALATGNDNDVGIIDGELKFIVFSYDSSLKVLQPVNIKQPVLDLLDAHLDEIVANAPTGLQSAFQTCFDMLWIYSELGIVSGMFQGLAISIPIAYVVLLVATSNLILSTIAIAGIASIVVTVLGTAQLLGWALGVAEAIAAVMVVGLSVDYSTLHGTSYAHAAKEGFTTRLERFIYSSIMLGPTVLAGALTTGGSAAVMFAGQLAFFNKMAILLTSTIGYSLLITEFFVMPLFRVIGPQGTRGDWVLFWKARHNQCLRRSSA